jgi:hypothetical protein|tara:strand:+ start:5958 stop:6116 length:159 start_codon:yes stop_codon:yes gene_type:complete
MNKQISKSAANEFGAYAYYTDGSSVKFTASTNKTIVEDKAGNKTVLVGRQLI